MCKVILGRENNAAESENRKLLEAKGASIPVAHSRGVPAIIKESSGAESRQVHYEYYLNRHARYQLARSIWKQMPLQVTKWLGPRLIKDIP